MSSASMTAEKTEAAPAAAPTKGRPKMGKKNKILLIITSLVAMAIFRTGFMFIVIALMPAIVAYYVDVSRKRYMFRTIMCFNLAGLMPFLAQMASYGPNSVTMQNIMGNASNWMIIYGSAFMGLLLVRTTPIIAHAMITGFHQSQVSRLGSNQKRIEGEWGPEVTQFSKRDDEDSYF